MSYLLRCRGCGGFLVDQHWGVCRPCRARGVEPPKPKIRLRRQSVSKDARVRICDQCGVDIEHRHQAAKSKYCQDCSELRIVTGAQTRYNRARAKLENRTCKQCGVSISDRSQHAIYCFTCAGERGRDVSRKIDERKRKAAKPSPENRKCEDCGVSLAGRHGNTKRCYFCSDILQTEYRRVSAVEYRKGKIDYTVNGNRKLHILGNRKLRTFMRFPWRAAVTSAVGVDRVLGWAAGAERPERRPRTSPCPLGPVAITALFAGQGLPAPAMPPWIGEDSDGHASGSCCRGC